MNQTFEVLLTTPLSATEIVSQKAKVLRRFIIVLAAPLLTIFIAEWLHPAYRASNFLRYSRRVDEPALYLITALLTVIVYFPLVSWLSLWIGLRTQSRFRAILTALIVIVVWCIGPIILLGPILRLDPNDAAGIVLLASPLTIPFMNEVAQIHLFEMTSNWLPVCVNFVIYAAILNAIRARCLRRADVYLRR